MTYHFRFSESTRKLIQDGCRRAGRGAMAIVLSASMAGAALPVQAIAEDASSPAAATSTETGTEQEQSEATSGSESEAGTSQEKTEDSAQSSSADDAAATKTDAPTTQQTASLSKKLDAAVAASSTSADSSAVKQAAAPSNDQAPAFDEKSAIYNAGDVKLKVDGEDAGTFSVFQAANPWTAGTPTKGADGRWRVELTISPKAENRIPGHFGDSGYELDESASKLTLTYVYVPTTGRWITSSFADRATVAYKKADKAPAFDITKQSIGVVVYAAGEWDPAYEGTIAIPASMVESTGAPYKKDGKWTVDVELKQGTPKDYGVEDKTADGVYLFDEANSVTSFSFVYDGKSWTAEPTEGGDPQIAFYQVEAPDADAIVNAKVTVKTTDGTKEGSYYLGAGTYEIGPVVEGYTNPMCVVTLRADQQQSYVDEFNADQKDGQVFELAAKPNDIQFYFSYDPETQEWTNTTTDQYIYVKKAPEKAPAFDAASLIDDSSAVAARIELADGTTIDADTTSVKDAAASYEATDPVQDENGDWTATLTIVPKSFEDYPGLSSLVPEGTYELDESASTLTLTYRYSKAAGTWTAEGPATVVFQQKAATPEKPSTDNGTNSSGTGTTTPAADTRGSTKQGAPAQAAATKTAATTASASALPNTGDAQRTTGAAAGIIGLAGIALAAVGRLLQKRRDQE